MIDEEYSSSTGYGLDFVVKPIISVDANGVDPRSVDVDATVFKR